MGNIISFVRSAFVLTHFMNVPHSVYYISVFIIEALQQHMCEECVVYQIRKKTHTHSLIHSLITQREEKKSETESHTAEKNTFAHGMHSFSKHNQIFKRRYFATNFRELYTLYTAND